MCCFQAPASRYVREISGKKTLNEVFLSFESFTVPMIIYRVDLGTSVRTEAPKLEEWRRTKVPGLDGDEFSVQQIFFESKDKTKVFNYFRIYLVRKE